MFSHKNRLLLGIFVIFLSLMLSGAACQNQGQEATNDQSGSMMEDDMTGENMNQSDDQIDSTASDTQSDTNMESDQAMTTAQLAEPPSIVDMVDWETYGNDTFAYSVSYPVNCDVLSNDFSQGVNFSGPLSQNEHWPNITITHNDGDFYHPEANTDLANWVSASFGYQPTDTIGIDGIEALHFVQARSPQAYGADYYYFVKDGQLFNITLLHTADRQDWPLYMKFLASFHFKK